MFRNGKGISLVVSALQYGTRYITGIDYNAECSWTIIRVYCSI